MKKNIVIVVLSVLVLVLGFNAFNAHIYEEKQGSAMEDAMHDMTAGLEGKEGAAFDQEFLSQMIVHHEGAIVMARLALEHAEREEIRDLAQAIIEAQEKEVAEMMSWQDEWFGAQSHTH